MKIELILPAPPSANKLFRQAGAKRVKTREYDAWRSEAAWRIRQQDPRSIDGPCFVMVGCERKSARADIDNMIKPTLDALQEAGTIRNDKSVDSVLAFWLPSCQHQIHVVVMPSAPMTIDHIITANGGGWFVRETE